jgi:heat shock protein HtpX
MQSFKAENQRKTTLLLIWFPVVLLLIFWVVLTLFFTDTGSWNDWWNLTMKYFPIVLVGLGIWGAVSFYMQKDIMFWLSGAKPITRKDNPEVYNIVENLCISKWLPMPKIAIMDEPWMNAFATWWKQKDSRIAFTSGLLENLNKKEVEAVAGHELTHLINKDSMLMYVAYVFVWVVSLAGQYLLRTQLYGSSSSDGKKSYNGMFIFWIAFLALWYLFYPLMRLAISRKREYMADLWSVELTRDNQAMISALRKISTNSYVSKANDSISSFFIAEPKIMGINKIKQWMRHHASNGKKIKTSIRDPHPSIDDRIARLQSY